MAVTRKIEVSDCGSSHCHVDAVDNCPHYVDHKRQIQWAEQSLAGVRDARPRPKSGAQIRETGINRIARRVPPPVAS